MFRPTKPFDDRLSTHPKEPSLRIGRTVPEHAVNLAYYYNPTATDAEKILTAEAPRNTIDHRVEEAYRYLFNQATDDDDLFPGFVWYEDEEGYKGRLGRMYVQWYPEAHMLLKNVQQTKEIIVTDKAELPKMIEYADADGYVGNLYLDATEYQVTKTKDVTTADILDVEVFNHELSYKIITLSYLDPKALDAWMIEPTSGHNSTWPKSITVTSNGYIPNGGNNIKISNYIKSCPSTYNGATGELLFDGLEYEQVAHIPASSGGNQVINFGNAVLTTENYQFPDTIDVTAPDFEDKMAELEEYVQECKNEAVSLFSGKWEATYNPTTDKYDYTQIEDFVFLAQQYCSRPSASFFTSIQSAMDNNIDIVIMTDRIDMKVDKTDDPNSLFHFEARFKAQVAGRGNEGVYQYNVIAKYAGTLKKTVTHIKEVASEYKATCSYVGITRKVWYDYDGVAYYRGAVTKGNGVGNVNPEGDNEILMFSDENGYLRRPVWVTDQNGVQSLKNFYRVESDYVYLTDVFKDGIACFYRYPLKKPIYDYRGPDDYGFYEGNAIKMFTSNLKDIPDDYKYNLKLIPAELETVTQPGNNFGLITKQVPMRYRAELYTSFISSSTDTFKVTYNAFDDNDKNNVALDNGVTEEVYCYPFMHQNKDFFMESVDKAARINKIKLPVPVRIQDTRRYVTFTYTITAERKSDGKSFTTIPRTVSILNRDYVLPIEHAKFDGRGMIISPQSDGVYLSPLDLVLQDQAAARVETIVTSQSTDFVFFATITNIQNDIIDPNTALSSAGRGAINIKCNSDGSGYITAETTVETGFFDDYTGAYTKKLCLNNPYFIEGGYIYPGFKVKCVDARHITVLQPREEHLLQSWYPRIQFGHYSQILDQYGTHTKVCYSMPEYDSQHFSPVYGKPYVDIKKEKVEILNSHMVKTKCYPLFVRDIPLDKDMYVYKNKVYKVFYGNMTWKDAQTYCVSLGGNLAMPKTQDVGNFIINVATKYNLNGLWLGATDEVQEGTWRWVDGTLMTYTNWANGEPNNSGGNEHYLETYTNNNAGKWNDLPNSATQIDGFICEWDKFHTIKLFKEVNGQLFNIAIRDVSFSDGIIITSDTISEADLIVCDYTYLEESYVYRGFWQNSEDFARIDLNPNMYHTFSDLTYTPSQISPTKNLFNKVIYFFMKPSIEYEVKSSNDSLIFNIEDDAAIGQVLRQNHDCLYHQIDNAQPADDHDIYIGSIYIRQNTSLHSTILVDSRTRGGGLIESMPESLRKQLEPESDYYLDIGYYDGEPYQENGVIIVRLDNRLLKEFGGRFTQGDIETKVKRWLGFGVYPIIEYVDTYTKKDMPQYNLEVQDSYVNIIEVTPEILLECVQDS